MYSCKPGKRYSGCHLFSEKVFRRASAKLKTATQVCLKYEGTSGAYVHIEEPVTKLVPNADELGEQVVA